MDGILVVAKPVGPTSHDVVGLIRRLSGTKRVGHGGTLDPFASGVLPIFLGKATRLVEYHLGDRKRYRATICFGASSTTDDLEGELTPSAGPPPSREAFDAALEAFRGPIRQRPPDYSAIKVAGRRAYAMARAGQPVELALRDVTIHAIDVVSWDGTDAQRPVGVVDVECSAGTYVRSLARDLGAAVGSAAYLGALIRTASGPFELAAAIEVETIRAAAADDPAAVERLLLPLDAGLDSFPRLTVDATAIGAISRGQAAALPGGSEAPPEGPILIVDDTGRLIAVATLKDGRLAPDKVLVDMSAAAAIPGSR
ncbi:MAG TPA: tRNA pseudouridine(55) synthase TruB [Candidatus Limnocylindrales bacterium]|nr:tRNA pseudouridine(55) synthase TruB [Candidatus Limnocylindrales bacterium]